MARKRKYTRSGDKAQGFECTKQKCKWQGTDYDKARRPYTSGGYELVCPNCGNPEFYGLIEFNAT